MYRREVLFNRMYGIISPTELETLKEKTVAIPGCGGVGYTHAEMLVRSGIGNIHISDLDTFGLENMNRQFGATIDSIGEKRT
jgi:tRNA A37 threonylcarbamoyladenosine dehydratase